MQRQQPPLNLLHFLLIWYFLTTHRLYLLPPWSCPPQSSDCVKISACASRLGGACLVCLRMIFSGTSVSRNVLHFNCILKAESSCTCYLWGIWCGVLLIYLLFIPYSLLMENYLETADEQWDSVLEKKEFWAWILILVVSDSLCDLSQLIWTLWGLVFFSSIKWRAGGMWVDSCLGGGAQDSLLYYVPWYYEYGSFRNLVWYAQLQDSKLRKWPVEMQ